MPATPKHPTRAKYPPSGRPGGRPRRVVQVARTDVLSHRADPHALLKIAAPQPRRPHLHVMSTPARAYLCASWNTHSRPLDLAGNRPWSLFHRSDRKSDRRFRAADSYICHSGEGTRIIRICVVPRLAQGDSKIAHSSGRVTLRGLL